ncbi:unnamed protein product [Cyprideis torosa]|uniref:Uncharacterized protein n=1 Tax=Cyprideis torosa TaxID=163714 RepID=A0A7R8ZSH3_9CRUS|nr:unnamed protein product [Cyprideis torosa]CAG0905892.1 unnamed protein product [Cyprideis torosa]
MVVRGVFEKTYTCCSGDVGSVGCCNAPTHVSAPFDPDDATGYTSTMDKGGQQRDVYALDCEMCYTTAGTELTRLTVIGPRLQVVHDTFVKPTNPILDYNTRYSGITKEDLQDCSVSLLDVQCWMLENFSKDTILIGHSLDSDLRALKLIHRNVVDTSVVFPHKRGPPYKKALKTLCGELLKKIIQEDVNGHDSAEDARSCMELMLMRVKEDIKKIIR